MTGADPRERPPSAAEPLVWNVSGLLGEIAGAVRDYAVEGVRIDLGDELRLAAPIDGRVHLARTNRGLIVTADILIGGPLTGAAMNPARWFGPAVASGYLDNWYVYWIGPLIGAALGGLSYRYVFGPADEREPIVMPDLGARPAAATPVSSVRPGPAAPAPAEPQSSDRTQRL